MHRLTILFLAFFCFFGCNRPISNPERIDPIYQDIDNDISIKQRDQGALEKDIEQIKKELAQVRPQTGEFKIKMGELFESKGRLERVVQELKYLKLRKESRAKFVQTSYMRAFEKGEKWPNPEEFEQYRTNKRLNTASRNWDDHLKDALSKRQAKAPKKEQKKASSH